MSCKHRDIQFAYTIRGDVFLEVHAYCNECYRRGENFAIMVDPQEIMTKLDRAQSNLEYHLKEADNPPSQEKKR